VSWRALLYLCLLAFVVTLAVIIGWRLSDQAMSVIIGVVAGVAVSVPTSLVVVSVALRRRSALGPIITGTATPPAPPQVIVVHATPPAPPASPEQRSLTVLPAYAAPQPTALNGLQLEPRQFTIMGEEDDGR
jgi:hypothetical protein